MCLARQSCTTARRLCAACASMAAAERRRRRQVQREPPAARCCWIAVPVLTSCRSPGAPAKRVDWPKSSWCAAGALSRFTESDRVLIVRSVQWTSRKGRRSTAGRRRPMKIGREEALGLGIFPLISIFVCNAVAVCPPDVRGRSGRRGSEGAARWRRLCLTALRTCRYGCTSRSAAAGGDPVSGWALPLPPRAPLPPLHVMQPSEGKHCSSNLIPPVIVLDSMLAHSQRILHTLHSSAAAFSPRTCPAPCPTATPSVSLPQALGQRGHQPQLPRPLHRWRVCEQQLRQRQRGR